MKKAVLTVSLLAVLLFCGGFSPAWIQESAASEIIAEAADVRLVVMESKQSKTVEVEQTALFDFGILPVVLLGPGNFTATFSRTGTYGELVFLYFRGFGLPSHDINIARTPVTMKVKSSVEEPWSVGFIMYGVISSSEPTPYMYNIKLDF